jgi:glycosyltransferase involved in cell wall biosynthesis
MTARVVVANPGSIPEMLRMANALADAGVLRSYIAPFSPTASELDGPRLAVLGPIGRALRSQLWRRVVSESVARSERPRAARIREIALVAGLRAGLSSNTLGRLVTWRNREFEASVARHLDRHDTDLIAPAGAALGGLVEARSLGIRGWLDCPIAHHGYASRLQLEEARLNPAFAESLQVSTRSEARRLDQEIGVADELIVLSSFQRRTFVEAGVSPDRLHVLPLGVDTDAFRPVVDDRDRPFTIGFVGQLTQRKGLSYLLAAFEALRPSGARLLMVGRPIGGSRPWNIDGVEHHPAVARSQLPRFYAQMDVFVLPSLVEGFGLTALEAMACGVPVIVSENTFGSDVVRDGQNGYLVPIRDVEAIVGRLRGLAGDEALRASIGANARVTAEEYSWDAFGHRLVELITRAPMVGSVTVS